MVTSNLSKNFGTRLIVTRSTNDRNGKWENIELPDDHLRHLDHYVGRNFAARVSKHISVHALQTCWMFYLRGAAK